MNSHPLRTVMSYLRQIAVSSCDEAEDAVLLERFVAARDESAFNALVQRHGPLVYGVCRRLLDDVNDADDVFQATFVVLAKKAGAIRKRGSVSAWLYGVAYRIARRVAARARRRRAEESKAVSAVPIDPSAETAWRELRPVLDEELSALPEKYRLPLVLCYLEGRTWDEAARALGWPRGSMTRRLEKARELLAARLKSRGLALSAAGLATLLTNSTQAAVPASLQSHAVQAALLSAGSAALPTTLAPLVEGELRHMALAKIKLALVAVLSIGVLGGAWWVFHSSSVAAPAVPEAKAEGIKLPADPNAAVITIDFLGGGIRRISNDPVMIIRGNGTVTVSDPWGFGAAGESKLTPRELQDLLQFIIRDRNFFGFNAEKVQKAVGEQVKAGGPAIAVGGGSTVIVRINADGKEHEARYYAVETFAKQYPKVKELGQLRDIADRLQYPTAPALTAADISTAVKRDGKTIVNFQRLGIDAAKDPRTHVRANLVRPEKGEPKITVEAVLKFVERPEK
jgi:RNA polymerase sigma factor (sigma-70 family)